MHYGYHRVHVLLHREGHKDNVKRVYRRASTEGCARHLNANWFLSLADAQAKIEAWRAYYNESRPHSALEWGHTRRIRPPLLPAGATAMSKEPEVPASERY